jgi:kynurenine formamidase
MKLWLDQTRYIQTEKGIDISMPLRAGSGNVSAWHCPPVRIEPVVMGDFIGDVNQGGSVNFRNIFLNPHGHGTHTECVGHISREPYTINQCLREFYFHALLVTVVPENSGKDRIITKKTLQPAMKALNGEKALVIRTMPNDNSKLTRQYTSTNPPFVAAEAMTYINECGFDHLLIDTPSVDAEEDGGKLAAHHIFWNYPKNPLTHKTISELIYVDNKVKDGHYFLAFQICSLENDASPSKILLYNIESA